VAHAGDQVVQAIRIAFEATPHPGDPFLQGSFDGEEPYEEIAHFKGKPDWSVLEPTFLDARYCALSFFSEGGFRFYLPAYLIADVRRQLQTADPAFHLIHGFSDHSHAEQQNGRVVVRRWGGSHLLNPRRYGAMTWYDHARYRLSVFSREEAQGIVTYLRWRQAPEQVMGEEEATSIEAALRKFWLERARTAATAADLRRRVAEDQQQ
jgi:hypothetical protein